jgi:hypothetical protein
MRMSFALIVFGVLGGSTSASALTNQPVGFLSSPQIGPELVVVRRPGAAHPYHYYRYRDYRRYQGPPQHRQYVEPQTRAAPMQRVPQVAPLAPRVGR